MLHVFTTLSCFIKYCSIQKKFLYTLKIPIHIVLYILKYYINTFYWFSSEKPQRMRRAFLSGVLPTFQHFSDLNMVNKKPCAELEELWW